MSTPRDFDYPLILCNSFDQVLSGDGTETSIPDIVELTLRRGRLLLHAAAGAGKTRTLQRAAKAAIDAGHRVGTVEVQKLVRSDLELNGVDTLLRATEPQLTYEELAGGESLLLLVDGLSEASSDTADLVLRAVDEWAALGPTTGTIVADRLTRRPVSLKRWQLATLGPVPRSTISEVIGRSIEEWETGLLESPVNLDIVSDAPGRALASRSDAIEHLLQSETIQTLDRVRLENVALRVYRERGRRSIPAAWLRDEIGEAELDNALRAGLVAPLGADEVTFRHHLVHDYLAARAAAGDPSDWGHGLFDVLTLRSSSYDVLVMLLELIHDDRRATLIRRVYDWNLYAASYLLSRDKLDNGETDATTESQILALLGERRFDHFLATRRQVEDALALHGGPLAMSYREASSVDEVVEVARAAQPADNAYSAWLHVFACDVSPSPSWLVDRMRDADGVDGWTATNVVRRLGLDSQGCSFLRELLDSGSSVVRWRAVHALGVAGTGALDDLFHALADDKSPSVRFGALRSIVDQAFLTDTVETRLQIFERLAAHSEQIIREPNLARELARVLHVDNSPDAWIEGAAIVLEHILALEKNPIELEKWRRVGSSVRTGNLEMV